MLLIVYAVAGVVCILSGLLKVNQMFVMWGIGLLICAEIRFLTYSVVRVQIDLKGLKNDISNRSLSPTYRPFRNSYGDRNEQST